MSLSDRARLARNLRIAREAARVSQTDAGKAVGKTRGTIVNWENPARPAEPDSDEVAILATLYGLTSRDLRFGELAIPSTAIVAQQPFVPPPGATNFRSFPDPDATPEAESEPRRRRGKAGGDR